MKLKFGDPASIKYRDNAAVKRIVDELMPKIKCPYCKAPANDAYTIDLQNDLIGWNFECKPECVNSMETAVERGCEVKTKTYTHLNGKFYPAE